MATLGEIRERVRRYVIDVNDEVEAEIVGFVQQAQVEAEDRRSLKCFEAKPFYLIKTLFQTVTKPSDWNGIREDPFLFDAEAVRTKLQEITNLYLDTEINTLDYGVPTQWHDLNTTTLTFYPIPDNNGPFAGSYAVFIPYWKRLSTLTADGDTNWLTDNAESFLVWRAASLGMEFNDDPRADRYEAKAFRELARVRRGEKTGRIGRGFTITPTSSSRIGRA